jgi:hypothetical protein
MPSRPRGPTGLHDGDLNFNSTLHAVRGKIVIDTLRKHPFYFCFRCTKPIILGLEDEDAMGSLLSRLKTRL